MSKNIHEIRDPIHTFVRLDSHEREVLNSRPFQRLRHIHQLALTYLVYPAATHRRFEHSLGVMELASRIYDVVTTPDNVTEQISNLVDQISRSDEVRYWRRVLRMAALCHDLGHLPFSHAAEHELLHEGWDHERLTRKIICSDEMRPIWNRMTPPLRELDIVKLAIGKKKAVDLEFSDWEALLSEIVVGDMLGADRMDYLLRDSHHTGVAYGRFDHYRLIDTMRILPASSNASGASEEPALGIEEGGIQSAEALMLARYFMYSQVYFHPIRRIYDIHLKEFLREWLSGQFPIESIGHLRITDNEATAAMLEAAFDPDKAGHLHARRIICREHFKRLYERNPTDVEINPEAGELVMNALCAEYGAHNFRRDRYAQRGGAPDVPVRLRDDQIVSSLAVSKVLKDVPVVSVDFVFSDRGVYKKAEEWLKRHKQSIIRLPQEEGGNG